MTIPYRQRSLSPHKSRPISISPRKRNQREIPPLDTIDTTAATSSKAIDAQMAENLMLTLTALKDQVAKLEAQIMPLSPLWAKPGTGLVPSAGPMALDGPDPTVRQASLVTDGQRDLKQSLGSESVEAKQRPMMRNAYTPPREHYEGLIDNPMRQLYDHRVNGHDQGDGKTKHEQSPFLYEERAMSVDERRCRSPSPLGYHEYHGYSGYLTCKRDRQTRRYGDRD